MKIILISDVEGLGARGDMVGVKDGYANNYLIPKGLAVRCTKGKAKEASQLAKEKMAKADRDLNGRRIQPRLSPATLSRLPPRRAMRASCSEPSPLKKSPALFRKK